MATAKQIEANRRNSRKSTGPKTDGGKDRSRCNALTHGLSGAGVVRAEGEAEAVRERMAEWHSSLRPFDAYQSWLLEVVAAESLRIERCRAREMAIREEAALQAEEAWDEDRRREAEEVAAGFGTNPGLAIARLRSNAAGCRLLLGWWLALGRALEAGDWDQAQAALAMDLLGVPPALRSGVASPLDPGLGRGRGRAEHRRRIVAAEVGRLERLLAEVMTARDERKRQAAALGFTADEGRDLAQVRRYEGACMHRLQWARAQIRRPEEMPSARPRPRRGDLRPGPMPPPTCDETRPIRSGDEASPGEVTNPGDETKPIRPGDEANPGDETKPNPPGDETKPIRAGDETKPISGSLLRFSGDLVALTDDEIVEAAGRAVERGYFGLRAARHRPTGIGPPGR